MDDSTRNMSRDQVKSRVAEGTAEIFHAGPGRVAFRALLGAVFALVAFDALAQQQFLNRGRRGADVTVDPSVIEDLGPRRTLQQLLLPDYTRQSVAPVRLRPPAPATTASRQPAANTARPPANRSATAAAPPRTIAPQTAQPAPAAPAPESAGQRPPQTAALPTLRPPASDSGRPRPAAPDSGGPRPPAPDLNVPRPAGPLATLQPPPAPQRPPVASAPPASPPAAAPPPVANAPRPAPGATAPPPPDITPSPPPQVPPRAPVTAQATAPPPPLPPAATSTPPAAARPAPPASAPPTAARPAAPNLAALPPSGAAAPTARVDFNLNSAELSETGKSVIANIADQLMKDDNLRLQVVAYATDGESVAEARRLSLSRALTVRSLLIDKGVRSTRLDVKALGTKADDGPSDRVDLVLVKR